MEGMDIGQPRRIYPGQADMWFPFDRPSDPKPHIDRNFSDQGCFPGTARGVFSWVPKLNLIVFKNPPSDE